MIPRALAADIADAALEREPLEQYILGRVDDGESILGVYPPDADTLAGYQASTSTAPRVADPTAIPLPAPAVATDYWAGVRFEDDEYRARFKRLRDQLVRRSLDAAVIADERTTWYFSGFGDSVQIGSKSRPRLLVLPVSGSPCAFVHSSTVTTVREMVWFDDVRGYDELRSAPVEEIAQLLRELGAQRIGVELAGGELQPDSDTRMYHGCRSACAPPSWSTSRMQSGV